MSNRFLILLASAAAAIGLTSAVNAADLARRAPPPPPVAAIPIFTWTGFYVGVNAGWAWSDNNRDDLADGVFIPPGTFGHYHYATSGTLYGTRGDDDNGGFAGGGQVGYNWQFGAVVIGAEADIQGIATDNDDSGGAFTFVRRAGAEGIPRSVRVVTTNGLSSLDWFGTVRGRLGFAFDRTLVYATGGFAYAGGGDSNDFCGGIFFDCGNDDTRTGWTVGGGLEYAFTNNFTARVEGLWVSFDNDNNRFSGVAFDRSTRTLFVSGGDHGNNEFGVVRAGLNWKFGTY